MWIYQGGQCVWICFRWTIQVGPSRFPLPWSPKSPLRAPRRTELSSRRTRAFRCAWRATMAAGEWGGVGLSQWWWYQWYEFQQYQLISDSNMRSISVIPFWRRHPNISDASRMAYVTGCPMFDHFCIAPVTSMTWPGGKSSIYRLIHCLFPWFVFNHPKLGILHCHGIFFFERIPS